MTTIIVQATNQYGRKVFRPVNQEAYWLTDLAGTKTLTPNALGMAERLGMTIELQHGPSDWREVLR